MPVVGETLSLFGQIAIVGSGMAGILALCGVGGFPFFWGMEVGLVKVNACR